MKIIAFAGSNSSNSINHQLVSYACKELKNSEVIKLTDYDLPMYSIDKENTDGFSDNLKALSSKIEKADKIIVSVSEHNGNISAFFKNTLDWLSRYNRNFLEGKEAIILSTSPGGRGGASALAIAEKSLPHFGANVIGTLSVGNFFEVFDNDKVVNKEIDDKLQQILNRV